MHPAIIGTVRSLIVDVAMGRIPRSTERISSYCNNTYPHGTHRLHYNLVIAYASKLMPKSSFSVHFCGPSAQARCNKRTYSQSYTSSYKVPLKFTEDIFENASHPISMPKGIHLTKYHGWHISL